MLPRSLLVIAALLGVSKAYSGSTIGVQSTGLYSTYWLPTDTNSSGYAYGANGTQSPSNLCTSYNSLAACSVTAVDYNYTQQVAGVLTNKRTTCKTSTNAKCSKAALASYFTGNGVKIAFCTDVHIVIWSDQIPSWGSNQYIVPEVTSPQDDGSCANREYTATFKGYHIPINFYDSGSSTSIFSSASITSATQDPFYTYYNTLLGTTMADLGVLVDGTDTHDTLNFGSPCNLGICGEHIAQGGGPPHAHGDPYGPTCLYYNNATFYPNLTAHPPLIGFTYDGGFIYGRYLQNASSGWSTPLDICGGHSHDSYEYHYHTQVIQMSVTETIKNVSTTYTYPLTTPGPYLCWRGNVTNTTQYPAAWFDVGSASNTYNEPCSDIGTNYYVNPNLAINNDDGIVYEAVRAQTSGGKKSRSQSKISDLIGQGLDE